ncbi:hypothetical protein AAC387_Pa08g1339 [Persea americana]
MWFLGPISRALLSFLNQVFACRTEPLMTIQISVQVALLPICHFMAAVLPKITFRIGSRKILLNTKEHVLISGCALEADWLMRLEYKHKHRKYYVIDLKDD